ncbi:MAG: Spy/CpxP family protein refolding chaperone [Polaromonas sp.]|nr:Spy/CpxP family protein refolding chaperone [Polaromonas sp.]
MKRNMKSVVALAGAGLLLALSGCTQSYDMGSAMRGGDAESRADAGAGGYGMGMGMGMGPGGTGRGRMGDGGQRGDRDGHGMDRRGMGMGGMMGGGYGLQVSDLTAEQRTKITDIHKELRRKQWALMGQMHEQMLDARGWHSGRAMPPGGAVDAAAERKAYDARAVLHKQMFENSLEARQRIDGLLSPKQREQWRSRLELDYD